MRSSINPTIFRLPDSRRHQLPAIAQFFEIKGTLGCVLKLLTVLKTNNL